MRPLTLLAIVAIIAVPVVTFYDFNGNSFDVADRQVVLVATDSMDGDVHDYAIDSFPANTLVMIEHLSEQEKLFLRVGDVVSYNDGGSLVHHRVVQTGNGYVYVHGDNNHSMEKVALEDINGRVVGTNWVIGHILAAISANFLLFLCCMFVVGSIAIVFAVYFGSPKGVAQ